MRVVHISAHDRFGGAARAAYRLHAGLRELGCDSAMLVGVRDSDDPDVRVFQPPSDPAGRMIRYGRRKNLAASMARYRNSRPAGGEMFSDDRSEHQAALLAQIPECDVIHLHWVAGLFDYRAFLPAAGRRASLVWTLHDMNAFTGGCHYDRGCGRFAEQCGCCPQIGSHDSNDLSRAVWKRKKTAFAAIPAGGLHMVTPSRWLAREAQRSPLLKGVSVSTIPYGMNAEAFAPREKSFARAVLGIPANARVLLFAAHWIGEERKGFRFLAEALSGMTNVPDLFLLSLGKSGGTPTLSIPHRNLGYVESEHLLSLVYSAADVFVLPSMQDNLPNTMLESLACGTPVAAFRVGGVAEVLEDGVTGMLAEPGDAGSLRSAILEFLEVPARREEMGANGRSLILQKYTLRESARRYAELYSGLGDAARAHRRPELSE